MQWHAQGVDIDQAMLSLSIYIGHAMVTNTYWQLSAVPELMALAAGQFEAYMSQAETSREHRKSISGRLREPAPESDRARNLVARIVCPGPGQQSGRTARVWLLASADRP